MNIANKYLTQDEYDKEWEPKYQTLEKKYFNDDGNPIGDMTNYNEEIEKLDYYYAKSVSLRIQDKIKEQLDICKETISRSDYNEYEKTIKDLNALWNDFNTPFHYKMNARVILEKV